MNPFKYSLDNKRYHTLNYYFKNKYGKKTFKIALDAGFSCPNKKNGIGCIFCKDGSKNNLINSTNLIKQFNNIKDIMLKKWNDAYYIVYFQANSNTYANIDKLKETFEPFLKLDNVIGIDIATRPDCINNDCLNYLIDLNKRTNLTIELGLQSMHDRTLKYINRGHNLKCFDKIVNKLKDNNINVVVHIINGLPYETKDMMIDTVKHLNKLNIDGIKIHMLYISKNTVINKKYKEEKFHILSKEEYIDIVINQLEILKPSIVIHRITGDPIKEDLIEPIWLLNKRQLINDIDKEMKKRNTYQGILYNKKV